MAQGVSARHTIHVSSACVVVRFDSSSTLHIALFTVSLIFHFIFHLPFHSPFFVFIGGSRCGVWDLSVVEVVVVWRGVVLSGLRGGAVNLHLVAAI